MNGKVQISKKEFYRLGGFKNPDLYRKANKNGTWKYYKITDNR